MDIAASLPPLLERVVRTVRAKHFPRGQILLYQGDKPTDVMILKNGIIRVYDIDDQGNEKILHLLKPPAILPFAFFSKDNTEIQWFYAALTDCDVCVLPATQLWQQMEADSRLTMYLMTWFSREVHELLVRLSSLGKTNAHCKIVAALKFLGTLHSTSRRSGWLRVNFAVSHQLLADLTGVTRESAAMTMKELSEQRIVRNPRQTILEINMPKLCDTDEC